MCSRVGTFDNTLALVSSVLAGCPLCFLLPEYKKCGLLTVTSLGTRGEKNLVTLLWKTRAGARSTCGLGLPSKLALQGRSCSP